MWANIRAKLPVIGKVVGLLVFALAGGVVGGHFFAPKPVYMYSGSAPPAGVKSTPVPGQPHIFALSTPLPTSSFGIQFNPATSSVISAGKLGIYEDSGLSIGRIVNTDGSFTEISPGWAQHFPPGSSIPLGVERLQAQTNSWLNVSPGDGRASWACSSSSQSNAPDSPNDYITVCGNNVATTGREDPTVGSMRWTIESICLTGVGCAPPGQMEMYFQFLDHTGTSWRMLTFNGLENGTGPIVGLVGNTVGLGHGTSINDANQIFVTSTQTIAESPDTTMRMIMDNGAGFIQFFQNSAQVFFMGVNNNRNQTQLDLVPGGNGTLSLGYNVDDNGASLKFRNGNFTRLMGGCDTLANRDACTATIEGTFYTTCSVSTVSDGVLSYCHCTSVVCNWVNVTLP